MIYYLGEIVLLGFWLILLDLGVDRRGKKSAIG